MEQKMTSPELNDCKTADLVLLVHGTQVHVHREYLRSVSERFDRILSDRWCVGNEMKMDEYDYATIYEYLRFLYTKQVRFTKENIESLYDLSVCYCEKSLQLQCEAFLVEQGILDPVRFRSFSEQIRLHFTTTVSVTFENLPHLIRFPGWHFRKLCYQFVTTRPMDEFTLVNCLIMFDITHQLEAWYTRKIIQKQLGWLIDEMIRKTDFSMDWKKQNAMWSNILRFAEFVSTAQTLHTPSTRRFTEKIMERFELLIEQFFFGKHSEFEFTMERRWQKLKDILIPISPIDPRVEPWWEKLEKLKKEDKIYEEIPSFMYSEV